MRIKNLGGEIDRGIGWGLVGGLVGGKSGQWMGRKWPLDGAIVASGGGESGHWMGRKWSTNWPRGRKW